ncbi:MAG: hypothetical protein AB8B32_01910, partial [Prochlorococcus sp.]
DNDSVKQRRKKDKLSIYSTEFAETNCKTELLPSNQQRPGAINSNYLTDYLQKRCSKKYLSLIA